ncbi:helix-turn-helix transcriptional regulator [Staphylococcus equorum]|uniref:helix-turn-helix domain-containing protein n=1 Tax=Staphylococcus equorum TaxID=246432 RepID=UPI000267D838|nr:helix-turn-helix transcriptional regulator [Staphylococcus equorum]MCM3071100.1 helix-turn-helix transcriptional regulator [Staphylococcus equorum]CCI58494.1 putative transcriptional regulator [Staphylococcus equorum subsp. equorum Mu2]
MNAVANQSAIKQRMFVLGLNLTDFSKTINVGVSYLSQIINGKKSPSPKLAKKMAEVLEVDITDIFIFEQKEA